MIIPMDSDKFTNFIVENNLFELTKKHFIEYLKNWWESDKDDFIYRMDFDLDTVLEKYTFEDSGASFNKSYRHEPPRDYCSAWVTLFDEEGGYMYSYTAFYDHELNFIDGRFK